MVKKQQTISKKRLKPILKYLKNLFAKKRILGNDTDLGDLVRADTLLTNLVNEQQLPGLAIVVLKEGKTLLKRGYGFADLQSNKEVDPSKTIFRTASASKPIAATAMAHMVAEGIIALDDSLYKHLPYFPDKGEDLSLAQLAGHTAGIRGYKGKEYALNKPYSIKDSLEVFQDDDLLFPPGTGYHYNSFDWVLLSLAMQEASGIPFADYVEQKVLQPLGMTNTFPEIPGEAAADQAVFYTKSLSGFREAVPVDNRYKLAGGGYLSTAEDIARLGQAYLEGKVLDQNTLAPFLTSQTIGEQPTYYGLGWEVSEDKHGRPFYGHTGNGVGGYSNFFVYPRQQMVFSILINCTDPKVQETLDEVIHALISESVKTQLPGNT